MIWPWRRRRREAELDEEIDGHLAMAARDHAAQGASPAEASYAARREFGNATLIKEVTRSLWGGVWLDQATQDLRLAARSLRRSPSFVLVAVLALGLGLGLSTTMFSVIDAAMHPEQAYSNGSRIFLVSPYMSIRAGKIVTSADLRRLIRERVPSLDAVVPWSIQREAIELAGEERDLVEIAAPACLFEVAGIPLELGRPFSSSEGDGAAVVGYGVWKAALGGRRDLTGAHVMIGDRSYAVVGVLPRTVTNFAAIVPIPPSDEATWRTGSMPLVRLKPGVPEAQAARELRALAALLTTMYSYPGAPWGLILIRPFFLQSAGEEVEGIHFAMVGAALVVLLIACVNLAHLMLARGLGKRREIAVRMALGADRRAAVRLMAAESVLIGVGGVVIGAVLAIWGARVIESIMPFEVQGLGYLHTQLSWRVFALGALAAVLAGLLFGIVPAIRVAFNVQITEPLKTESGTTTGGPRRRYSPLVIMEVAAALTLLVGGTLLLRTVHGLRNAPTGFDAETLVNASVRGVASYRATRAGRDSSASIDWEQVLTAARSVTGVAMAALENGSQARGAVVTAEMGADSTRMIPMQFYPAVTANYLSVYGLPILRGRDFEPGDAAGPGVAILSAVAAARLYPKGEAVGRMLKLGGPATNAPWVRIVGVARTPLAPWAGSPAGDAPLWVLQPRGVWASATLLVRTVSRDPVTRSRLRHALRAVPGVRTVMVQPFTWARDADIAYAAFLAKVFVALGAVGLSLAALGVYGVLAYAVRQRMREFGVRIAFGAEPRALFRLVMHDGLVMLLAGTGIGAFVALAAAPLFEVLSSGSHLLDAASLAATEAVLLVVGLGAAVGPARRAYQASPLEIIRAV